MTAQKNKLVIEVSGGIVQAVYADAPRDLDIYILDQDAIRMDENNYGLREFRAQEMTDCEVKP